MEFIYQGFKGTVPQIINYFNIDINRKTVYDRLSKGMSIEEALETPLRTNGFIYKGISGSIPYIINYFNIEISAKTVYDRLSKGWNINDSLESPTKPMKIK